MSIKLWHYCVLALLILAAGGADSVPLSFHISGDGVNPSDWTVAQLQTQLAGQVKPVEYKSHGADHTFNCVPLISMLQAAGAPGDFAMKAGTDPKVKNPQMRQVVLVSGRDGYAAVFSMAEVLPMVGNRTIWMALDEDGQPLAENDGPVRLIVPEDKMPARGVHEIASIQIIQLGAPTTQPQNP